jgi:hypothetical protein
MANNSGKHSDGKEGLRLVKKRPTHKSKLRINIEIRGDTYLLENQLNKMDMGVIQREFLAEMREIGDIELCCFEVEID